MHKNEISPRKFSKMSQRMFSNLLIPSVAFADNFCNIASVARSASLPYDTAGVFQ